MTEKEQKELDYLKNYHHASQQWIGIARLKLSSSTEGQAILKTLDPFTKELNDLFRDRLIELGVKDEDLHIFHVD